jgi:hypothetical protein
LAKVTRPTKDNVLHFQELAFDSLYQEQNDWCMKLPFYEQIDAATVMR